MARGMFRSRSLKRIKVRVPGGESRIHYKERAPSKAKCAGCKAELKGTPNKRVPLMKKLSKTEKRPERPFGGYYCSKCMREHLRKKLVLKS